MTQLLSADFRRLVRGKLLWILSALMIVFGIFMARDNVLLIRAWAYDDNPPAMEKRMFLVLFALPILSAIFSSLFIGAEYGNGAIRNKLIVGHKRIAVYLSNFIVCSTATILFAICYLIGYLGFACPSVGGFSGGFLNGLLLIFLVLLSTVMLSSLFVFVSATVTNRAYSVAVCILIAGALIGLAFLVSMKLEESEFYIVHDLDENGDLIPVNIPNPNYISGFARQFLLTVHRLNPCGQSMLLMSGEYEKLWLFPLLDCVAGILFCTLGLLLFRKKDLK